MMIIMGSDLTPSFCDSFHRHTTPTPNPLSYRLPFPLDSYPTLYTIDQEGVEFQRTGREVPLSAADEGLAKVVGGWRANGE